MIVTVTPSRPRPAVSPGVAVELLRATTTVGGGGVAGDGPPVGVHAERAESIAAPVTGSCSVP